MAPSKKLYYVISFTTKPFWMNDQFAVVPSKWVIPRENQVTTAFPLLGNRKLTAYIERRKSPLQSWPTFPVTIEFKTNVYKDALLYVDLRRQLRSSYITSATSKQTADGNQDVGELPTVISSTNDLLSVESHSSVVESGDKTDETLTELSASTTYQQICKKAIEHALFEKILTKVNEVSGLLEDYMKVKRQCSEQ